MELFALAASRFYCLKKEFNAHKVNTKKSGKTVAFQSKMLQAAEMLNAFAARFVGTPVLVVADSWFGNNGLFGPLTDSEFQFDLLSRLRSNTTLYDLPANRPGNQPGRSRKYGQRWQAVPPIWLAEFAIVRVPSRCFSMAKHAW